MIITKKTKYILLIILSIILTENIFCQEPLKEQIENIDKTLLNDNSNEYLEKETYNFEYNNDTLTINHNKIWKHGIIEFYVYSLPIKNIKSVESGKSEMFKNNTITFNAKSTELAFGHIYKVNDVIENTTTTYVQAFSKKDLKQYIQLEKIIKTHSQYNPD